MSERVMAAVRAALSSSTHPTASIERSSGESGASRLTSADSGIIKRAMAVTTSLQHRHVRIIVAIALCPVTLSGKNRLAYIRLADREIESLVTDECLLRRMEVRLRGELDARGVPQCDSNHALLRGVYGKFQAAIVDHLIGTAVSIATWGATATVSGPPTPCSICLESTCQWRTPQLKARRGGCVIVKYSPGCVKHTMCHACCRDLLNHAHRRGQQPRCPVCAKPIHVLDCPVVAMPSPGSKRKRDHEVQSGGGGRTVRCGHAQTNFSETHISATGTILH